MTKKSVWNPVISQLSAGGDRWWTLEQLSKASQIPVLDLRWCLNHQAANGNIIKRDGKLDNGVKAAWIEKGQTGPKRNRHAPKKPRAYTAPKINEESSNAVTEAIRNAICDEIANMSDEQVAALGIHLGVLKV